MTNEIEQLRLDLAATITHRNELQRQNDEVALFLSTHYGLGEGSIVDRFRALREVHESMALEAKEDARKIVSLEVQRDELLQKTEGLKAGNTILGIVHNLMHAVRRQALYRGTLAEAEHQADRTRHWNELLRVLGRDEPDVTRTTCQPKNEET